MSDSFRSTPPEQQWSGSNTGSNGHSGASSPHNSNYDSQSEDGSEVGKALLVGVLGGLVSAAGYFVYRRLPEEQKDRLQAQFRTLVAQKIGEIRQNFNL